LAFEPVAQSYNYTLVSYLKAVWPNIEQPPDPQSGVFQFDRIHPASYLQQVFADLLAYAWTSAEETIPADFVPAKSGPLPPPHFHDSRVAALTACRNPLSNFEHDESGGRAESSSLYSAPQRSVSFRWEYVEAPRKSGWQFDFQHRSPHVDMLSMPSKSTATGASNFKVCKFNNKNLSSSQTSGPKVILHTNESLDFALHFGAKPSLVVSYLKSYENFGRAMLVIDCDAPKALDYLDTTQVFFNNCKKNSEHPQKPTEAKCADCGTVPRYCWELLNGQLSFPFVLDGHWEDNSSQAAVEAFTTGYSPALETTTRALKPPIHVPNRHLRLVTPGWHTVSLVPLSDESSASASRPRFKLTGLKSC
jgi:hypothetical protein